MQDLTSALNFAFTANFTLEIPITFDVPLWRRNLGHEVDL